MACSVCNARFVSYSRPVSFRWSNRRSFHCSSPRRRLGASTYLQEWQTGAYHYSKQTSKNHPVAAQSANKLLEMYTTMQKSPSQSSAGTSSLVASRRRGMNKVFTSGTMAKDFGDRIVLDAFVYDHAEADAKQGSDRARKSQGAPPTRGPSSARPSGGQRGRRPPGPGQGPPKYQARRPPGQGPPPFQARRPSGQAQVPSFQSKRPPIQRDSVADTPSSPPGSSSWRPSFLTGANSGGSNSQG